MRDPEAAHIFPFATSQRKNFTDLHNILRHFWGEEKAETWHTLYENSEISQSLSNYLSLNHQLHFWFEKARFALKPLSQTDTAITVQFHWLRQTTLQPWNQVDYSGEALLDLANLRTPATWGFGLAHRASGVPIQTGQTFVIWAENPEDLPSFDLLELQWNLLRAAAICGAADVSDDEDDMEDDDDDDMEDDDEDG